MVVRYLFAYLLILIIFLQWQIYLILLINFNCVRVIWHIVLFNLLREIIMKGLLLEIGTCALRSLLILREIR